MTVERTRYVADLLVTKMNAAPFGVVAERRYKDDTDYETAELSSWFVPVIPATRQDSISGRCTSSLALEVDIGLIKRLPNSDTATVDAAMDLVGEVYEWLQEDANRRLGENYTIQSISIPILYSDEHLRNHDVFYSVMRVTVTKERKH